MSMKDGAIRKVLMTADTIGGVWTFAVELARELEQRGIEVILATLGQKPTSTQIEEIQTLANVQIIPSDYKLEWMQEPWKDIEESCRWIRQLETRYLPDVVHLNSYGHGSVAWNAPMVVTAHSCVVSWWNA